MPAAAKSNSAPAIALDQPDSLVPDVVVAREFGITLMSIWRWDHRSNMAEQGWPPPVQINGRNFRSRRALESFKARLIDEAVQRAASGKRKHAQQPGNLKRKKSTQRRSGAAA